MNHNFSKIAAQLHPSSSAYRFLEWADKVWEHRFSRHVEKEFDKLDGRRRLATDHEADIYLGVVASAFAIEILTNHPDNDAMKCWRRPRYNTYGDTLVGHCVGMDPHFIRSVAANVSPEALSEIQTAYAISNGAAPRGEPEPFDASDLESLDAWQAVAAQVARDNDTRTGAW